MELFRPTMKVADLVGANHYLILTLPRLGIPLGFGDKSVREVCSTANVPEELLLLICNVYTFDNYLPDKEELRNIDTPKLVSYLLASHRYYMEDRLPHIGRHLQDITKQVEAHYGTMLTKFYDDYQKEVCKHFRYEEDKVFPQLLSMKKIPKSLPPAHNALVDKLSDLTQIVYKYLPSNIMPDDTIELVFDILQLSSDLKKHTVIEEKVLIPYANL